MKHTILKANQLSSEFASYQIKALEQTRTKALRMLKSGNLEVISILIDSELDKISVGLYVDLAKSLGKAGAIIEVLMRNHVNLPTLDAFSMPFVDALKISQDTRISFDAIEREEWQPENPVSSVILMLPCHINYLSAEEIAAYYMDSAMVFDICVTLSGAFEEAQGEHGYIDLSIDNQGSCAPAPGGRGLVGIQRERDVA